MPQTFTAPAVLLLRVAGLVLAGLALCGALAWWAWSPLGEPDVNEARAQPIPFSHKHHVGDVGLDCRFCHTTVETAASPGLPAAAVCLTCHSQLFADQAVFAPLHQAMDSGVPIAWVHMNRLPDYVYFDHSIHVAKGIACAECHGRVDQQPLAVRSASLQMKWCFACHENAAPKRHLPAQVFDMPPATLTPQQLEALNRLMKLERTERMTDCSTCHR